MAGIIAGENYGASAVLEYRFFGLFNPYPYVSQTSLAVHPLETAIDDLVYFANNLKPSFPEDPQESSQVGPGKRPWY